ncbi:hypothetical protein VZC37_01030 [Gordonia sp. LSe1-13]|uniref:Uncharacterized protein n=1 Tax=Gordonia sesuvii TaxID=3116777 RepID=A0ABU7M712_9ACTN|nr:hypothetical protein [Gordonia sp. LSe1-13]
MNLADQIEAIARRATARVVAASNDFSTAQRGLAAEVAEHRASVATPDQRMRDQLRRDADVADCATPRILLPADMAEASPHTPVPDDPAPDE